MSKNGDIKKDTFVNRSQVARAIFNAAASMGISDREAVEKLTTQVIARLERPAALPGMEDLVPKNANGFQQHASDADILAMVKEFLATEKPGETQSVVRPEE